ncbi:hypothetical protein [Prolixibacter sp. NT017]|uniref:hypothetical protein n=1 Tax=Prolixibacter sp. NT017 TaxID=2652390 RepID=UPI0012990507|nr:hypothetical protein [Prolixibacter sp. NT017]
MFSREQATGAFMLFPDDEQLQVPGAHVLNDGVTGVQGARGDDWMKMMIRSLTENTLQLILVVDGGTLRETRNNVAIDYNDSL